MKSTKLLALSIPLIILSGCSSIGALQSAGESSAVEGRLSQQYNKPIAKNMVSTLAELDELPPTNTTIQMMKVDNGFGADISDALEDEGYGIKLVTSDVGQNYLSFKHLTALTEAGYTNTYLISVGGITLERDYAEEANNVVPTSAMKVTGANIDGDELDDSMFASPGEYAISSVVSDNPQATASGGTLNTNLTELFSQGPTGLNVHDLRGSNYGSLFTNYDNLNRDVLVFGNDSFRMNNNNKKIVSNMVASLNPETDIISIIGCSHGDTAIDNGNQILAEGRTQRVREAFLFAGVAPDLIKDEACWSSDYWDEVAPRRGVIVTHKRIKG